MTADIGLTLMQTPAVLHQKDTATHRIRDTPKCYCLKHTTAFSFALWCDETPSCTAEGAWHGMHWSPPNDLALSKSCNRTEGEIKIDQVNRTQTNLLYCTTAFWQTNPLLDIGDL